MAFLLPSLEEELSNSTIIITMEKRTFTKPFSMKTNRTKDGMRIILTSKLAMMGPFTTDAPVGSASGRYQEEWSRYPPTGRVQPYWVPGLEFPMGLANFRTVGSLWEIIRALMCRPVKFPSPARMHSTEQVHGISTEINMIPKRS